MMSSDNDTMIKMHPSHFGEINLSVPFFSYLYFIFNFSVASSTFTFWRFSLATSSRAAECSRQHKTTQKRDVSSENV